MQTLRRQCLALALLVSAVVPSFSQQPPTVPSGRLPPTFAWWRSESFTLELGLTADQAVQIDKIWEATRPELRVELDDLSRFESKLSRLIQEDADEAALSRQIDRVETARANANKTRSLMFVQMRKALTPDQRVRLDALHDRWARAQKSSGVGSSLSAPRRDSDRRPAK